MRYKPTTVQMPDLRLVVVRAERDREPEIKAFRPIKPGKELRASDRDAGVRGARTQRPVYDVSAE